MVVYQAHQWKAFAGLKEGVSTQKDVWGTKGALGYFLKCKGYLPFLCGQPQDQAQSYPHSNTNKYLSI